jgi:hypothetical protein
MRVTECLKPQGRWMRECKQKPAPIFVYNTFETKFEVKFPKNR